MTGFAMPLPVVMAERPGCAAKAAIRLVDELETPTLAEYGVDRDEFFAQIDKMAHDAMVSGSPQNTMKEITEEDVKQMYRELWD